MSNIKTGFTELDKAIGGIETGHVYTVASDYMSRHCDHFLHTLCRNIGEARAILINHYQPDCRCVYLRRSFDALLKYLRLRDFRITPYRAVFIDYFHSFFNGSAGIDAGVYENAYQALCKIAREQDIAVVVSNYSINHSPDYSDRKSMLLYPSVQLGYSKGIFFVVQEKDCCLYYYDTAAKKYLRVGRESYDMPNVNEFSDYIPIIKVVGIGGGGNNAINHMITKGIQGVEFIAADTDSKTLEKSLAPTRIKIQKKLIGWDKIAHGYKTNEKAVAESRENLLKTLEGADIVFIVAGTGGNTGAASVLAEYASKVNPLTFGVVTQPFSFEGKKRKRRADKEIVKLKTIVDGLIVIPNDSLLQLIQERTNLAAAFKMADDVLRQGVRGIYDLMLPGLIGVDIADVVCVMSNSRLAALGTGRSCGENAAEEATKAALQSPLLKNIQIAEARGFIISITISKELSLFDINESAKVIEGVVNEDADMVFGAIFDDEFSDKEVQVSIIAVEKD